MNKAMMKWVLTEQEDELLCDIATATACKVKGFREITRSNIKKIRPQVILELQKPTRAVRLKKELHRHIKKKLTEEVITGLRENNAEELLTRIDTKEYRLADVLLTLITGEEEHVVLAQTLFTSIQERGSLALLEPQSESVSHKEKVDASPEETPPFTEALIQEYEEKLSKEKRKMLELESVIKELREKRKAELQEWKKERKNHIEEVKKIKKDLDNKIGVVQEQEAVVGRLRAEIDKLQAEIKNLNEKKMDMETAEQDLLPKPPVIPEINKTKVVLIGENINESYLRSANYSVELVANSQIEEFIYRDSPAEEIWMLTFQISPSKQRKLRNAFPNNNFKQFATLIEFQEHINNKR